MVDFYDVFSAEDSYKFHCIFWLGGVYGLLYWGHIHIDPHTVLPWSKICYLEITLIYILNLAAYTKALPISAGVRWKRKTTARVLITEKYYLENIEYNGTNLEAIYHSDGRAIPVSSTYEYQYTIKDHLGNSRVMFKMVSSVATLIQENHYYPYGMEFEGVFTGSTNKYRYNGKELHDDFGLNLYDYGARWYDPSVGRFTGVDPISDRFPHVSTFNYAENSPIANVDLWGLQAENFMSKFRKVENLPIKTIHSGYGEIQRQYYEVIVSSNQKSFGELKSTFMSDPGRILDNSRADFGNVKNRDQSSSLKEGSNIEIAISGPLNNSAIRADEVSESANNFEASFSTLKGHIEAGHITFSGSVDEKGNITFSVEGTSRLSHGAAYVLAEGKSRDEQVASWNEVLSNVASFLKGTEQNRKKEINRYEYDRKQRNGIGRQIR